VNYLLDTHILIWLFTEVDKVPQNVKSSIASEESNCFFSMVSFWEISIKYSIGRLDLPVSLEELKKIIINSGFDFLPIKTSHIIESSKLPFHHQDPFDRLIIGQAIEEGFQLISKDRQFSKYEVSIHPWK